MRQLIAACIFSPIVLIAGCTEFSPNPKPVQTAQTTVEVQRFVPYNVGSMNLALDTKTGQLCQPRKTNSTDLPLCFTLYSRSSEYDPLGILGKK